MLEYKEKNVIDVLQDEFIPYAGEVLLNNLPSVCDGLLPAQRKVIYALYEKGITYDKPFIKVLRVAAYAMVYYVFGDMPLNGVIKNMANNSLNNPYLMGNGSFGDKQKREDNGSAARYIEAKLSKYSQDILEGINKKCIPFKRNFDNTTDEPVVLPSVLPNVLLNSSESIAVSEASKIPSHNLIEVCDAFIEYLTSKDIDKAKSILKGCDFSLGGQIVYNEKDFNTIYDTGKGSYTLVGKYKYDVKENKITIYEIPYGTYIETIDDRIRDCCINGKLPEIVDIHEGSDKDGIALDIYLKKHTNVDNLIKKLRKFTPFESKLPCNFTLIDIDNKTPKCMSLKEIIESWTQHRINCIKNETKYDIDKLEIELNKLYGLKAILDDLDVAIQIIRQANSDEDAKAQLINHFALNKEQADYITTIKLININKDWINKKISRVDEIETNLKDLKIFLEDKQAILNKIISQLEAGKKKYGQPRKTTVIYNDNTEMIDLVEDYNCHLVITQQGYIKKNLKYSDKQKLKDEDSIVSQIPTTNKSKILIFTDKANCYFLNTYKLNECLPSALGTYLPSLLELQDEKIIYVTATSDYSGYMYFAFKNGKVAKVPLSSYQTKQNRGMIVGAYNTNSKLVFIKHIIGTVDFMAKKNGNQYMVFSSDLLNEKTGKKSQGMITIQIKEGEALEEFHENTLSMAESSLCTYLTLNKAGKKLDI